MTESDWNSCTDPQQMLEFLPGKVSDRKLRLFACAYSRRIWHVLADSRNPVELAERYADGQASQAELEEAREQGELIWSGFESDDDDGLRKFQGYSTLWSSDGDAIEVAEHFPRRVAESGAMSESSLYNSEPQIQASLAREVFGNPFKPVTINPAWLTNTVVSLAQALYDDRAFDRLPVLADALEDSGCTLREMLNHCRKPGVHARGCWLIDLLLGKS